MYKIGNKTLISFSLVPRGIESTILNIEKANPTKKVQDKLLKYQYGVGLGSPIFDDKIVRSQKNIDKTNTKKKNFFLSNNSNILLPFTFP